MKDTLFLSLIFATLYSFCTPLTAMEFDQLDTPLIFMEADLCPLHEAAARGDLNKVKKLLKNERRRNKIPIISILGESPIHFAASSKNRELVKYLIEEGDNPGGITEYGSTPLHFACIRGGNLEMIKLLVAQGVDLNVCNDDNETPLMKAKKHGDQKMINFLLERGATDTFSLSEKMDIIHIKKDTQNK